MGPIKEELEQKFGSDIVSAVSPRPQRVFVRVSRQKFREMIRYAMQELGMDHLTTITGIDLKASFEVMYHLFGRGVILSIAVAISQDDPKIQTITDIVPGAVLYERELQDFFGIKVENIPDSRRFILPDVWPEGQYPLRKDWNVSMLPESLTKGLRRPWKE